MLLLFLAINFMINYLASPYQKEKKGWEGVKRDVNISMYFRNFLLNLTHSFFLSVGELIKEGRISSNNINNTI